MQMTKQHYTAFTHLMSRNDQFGFNTKLKHLLMKIAFKKPPKAPRKALFSFGQPPP